MVGNEPASFSGGASSSVQREAAPSNDRRASPPTQSGRAFGGLGVMATCSRAIQAWLRGLTLGALLDHILRFLIPDVWDVNVRRSPHRQTLPGTRPKATLIASTRCLAQFAPILPPTSRHRAPRIDVIRHGSRNGPNQRPSHRYQHLERLRPRLHLLMDGHLHGRRHRALRTGRPPAQAGDGLG